MLREIKEEFNCDAEIRQKLGDFEAKAAHDDAFVRLATYLVTLKGDIDMQDPELEEYQYIDSSYQEKGIKLPESIAQYIIPFLKEQKLLNW